MYSIIIPTLLPAEQLTELTDNIKQATTGEYELIVTSQPVSAAANRNIGLNQAKYPIVIMLDDDIRSLPQGWNETLAAPLLDEASDVIMVSARLLDTTGKPGLMTEFTNELNDDFVQVTYLPSACIAFRKDDTRFDEEFIGSGFEDSDFCMQLSQKYPDKKYIVNNRVKVIHLNERKNQTGGYWIKNQNYFANKWQNSYIAACQIPRFPITKKTYTLGIIAKNEEKWIARCINSAKQYVDEVVLVDTGSTDGTIAEARKAYPDIVVVNEKWQNDFSKARNRVIDTATKDWILFLDADEEVTHFDSTSLQYLLNTESTQPFVVQPLFFNKVATGTTKHHMTRLIPNNKEFVYSGAIHERIVNIKGQNFHSVRNKYIQIMHDGYTIESVQAKDKVIRNATMLKEELDRNPDNSYLWYHLGITYKTGGATALAVEALEKWLEMVQVEENLAEIDTSVGCSAYLGCLFQEQQTDKALAFITKWDARSRHNPDWNFNAAITYERVGTAESLHAAISFLKRNETMEQLCNSSVVSFDADTLGWKLHTAKGNILSRIGAIKEAQEAYKVAFGMQPNNLEILASLIAISARTDTFPFTATKELIALYTERANGAPMPDRLVKAQADIYRHLGYIEEAFELYHKLPGFDIACRQYELALLSAGKVNDVIRLRKTVERLTSEGSDKTEA